MDVRLIPLREARLDDLLAAAAPEDVWRLMPVPIGKDREALEAYVKAALADEEAGIGKPFAILQDGKVVGSTRFHAIELPHRKAEIGYTWHHPSVWRTGVNQAAKIQMLDAAFGEMDLNRVYFYIDIRNDRSQQAVARLGALREGELREDRILHDGFVRTTVVYGLLAREWPENRSRLLSRGENLRKRVNIPAS